MRHVEQHARAVAGHGVGARRPAVGEPPEHQQRALHDVVALAAPEIGHEAEAAGVVLVPRIVEAGASSFAHLRPRYTSI